MSRPRREWWSLRCSRRCPVRSLIRWVSSATWTRVLPVSCSFSPNWETISCLRSAVRLMRQRRVAGSPGDGSGLVDVRAHLLDERLDRVEALLAAQALEELEAQRLAVQVAVEVEQEGLDELAAAGHEHRPHADVRGRRVGLARRGRRPARVHAVARRDVAVGREQVRRREAELPAALVAVDDLADDRERRAEQRVGVLDRAAEHEAADVARGHDLAVDLEQRHDPRLEALVGRQELRVAVRAVAEAEVLPTHTCRAPSPPADPPDTKPPAQPNPESPSNRTTNGPRPPSE